MAKKKIHSEDFSLSTYNVTFSPMTSLFVPSDAKQTHNKWAATVQKSFPDDDGGTIALRLTYGQPFLNLGSHTDTTASLKPMWRQQGLCLKKETDEGNEPITWNWEFSRRRRWLGAALPLAGWFLLATKQNFYLFVCPHIQAPTPHVHHTFF